MEDESLEQVDPLFMKLHVIVKLQEDVEAVEYT
jgi:hypothetical protein